MVSATDRSTAKLGVKRLQVSGDHQETPLQQQVQFVVEALKHYQHTATYKDMVEGSIAVQKLVRHLRHRNPQCGKTIVTYLPVLKGICSMMAMSPDQLVAWATDKSEDMLEEKFTELDEYWYGQGNSPGTRAVKLAVLKTFLVANGVRKARAVQARIQIYPKYLDYALTCEDCRRTLEQCKNNADKVIISLLIESLQRIGTINSLIWRDVLEHLDNGEDMFLIKIDALRTKRNIPHWAPIGPLSTYYLRKLREDLEKRGIEVTENNPLIIDGRTLKPVMANSLEMRVRRLMSRAGVRGRKQGNNKGGWFEKRVHDFRKFGVVEMQRHGVNEQVIRYLMGQKRDTYSNWDNRGRELLEIYRENRPSIQEGNAVQEIVDYARSRGYDLDPTSLSLRSGDIQVHAGTCPSCGGVVEAK